MISIEDALIAGIGEVAKVDGHDSGSGTVNIFLYADRPDLALREVMRILGKERFMTSGLKAAFRERKGNDYHILWPPGLSEFSIM